MYLMLPETAIELLARTLHEDWGLYFTSLTEEEEAEEKETIANAAMILEHFHIPISAVEKHANRYKNKPHMPIRFIERRAGFKSVETDELPF